MIKRSFLALVLSFGVASVPSLAGQTPSPPGAKAYFANVKDGDTITGDTIIKFGLDGMTVVEAGKDVPNSGHFHIFIDVPKLAEGETAKSELDQNIVKDDHHIHYGKGQTEAKLTLSPGKHKIQLVLADKDHIPHSPAIVSEQITVIVK